MDAYISLKNSIQSEHYDIDRRRSRRSSPSMPVPSQQTIMAVSLMIAIISFYLSWSRNTMLGESTMMKIVYGFFAAMFGTTYLIFYYSRFLIESDMIKRLSLSGTEVFPRQMMIHDYLMV
jgi:hypothetical protein